MDADPAPVSVDSSTREVSVPAPPIRKVAPWVAGGAAVALLTLGLDGGAAGAAARLTTGATCATAFPSPGSHTAAPASQISLRDVVPAYAEGGTVSVRGSRTGLHSGRWITDSDGLGASFRPTHPFAADEQVSVAVGVRVCGSSGTTDTFTTAITPGPLRDAARAASPRLLAAAPTRATEYATMPGVRIPTLAVRIRASFGGQYFFETPRGGSVPAGLEIVDGHGQIVWYRALPSGDVATDLREQTYHGQPVLTWWEGSRDARFVIMNDHYQVIRTVEPADGLASNEHEFLLSDDGADAWLIGTQVVGVDLTARGGSARSPVIGEVAQEIDLATGNLLFEWHSLDHISPAASYAAFSPNADFDYYHMNSLDPLADGTVVISARNTHSVVDVSASTGAVEWQLGGKDSTFRMGPGSGFALQHDARMHGTDEMSLFDDEDAPPDDAPARAILLRLDMRTHTATLLRAYRHGNLRVPWQGNQQILANGESVVGWGSGGATSVYGATGRLLFDAAYPAPVNSYRAYLLPWSGAPTTHPAIVAERSGGMLRIYASWNGSTATTGWEVLGGDAAGRLHVLARTTRAGFQTAIALTSAARDVQVVALGSRGQALADSRVVTPRSGDAPGVVQTP